MALWAYQTHNSPLAVQVLSKGKELKQTCETARDALGYLYFHKMLGYYSFGRNYAAAAALGEHLSGAAFEGFEYRTEATQLARQLRTRANDFKDLTLPDNAKWQQLKGKWTGSSNWYFFLTEYICSIAFKMPNRVMFTTLMHRQPFR